MPGVPWWRGMTFVALHCRARRVGCESEFVETLRTLKPLVEVIEIEGHGVELEMYPLCLHISRTDQACLRVFVVRSFIAETEGKNKFGRREGHQSPNSDDEHP